MEINISLMRYNSNLFAKRHNNSQLSILYVCRRFVLNEDILWDKFAGSGSIEDYLQYSAHKEDNHDNC